MRTRCHPEVCIDVKLYARPHLNPSMHPDNLAKQYEYNVQPGKAKRAVELSALLNFLLGTFVCDHSSAETGNSLLPLLIIIESTEILVRNSFAVSSLRHHVCPSASFANIAAFQTLKKAADRGQT